MAKTASVLMLALCFNACSRVRDARPSDGGDDGPEQRVEAFFEGIPSALAAGGPAAWLDVFDDTPSFFMASDGSLVFPDRATAETFLADFAPRVRTMSLAWIEPRFTMLAEGVVAVASAYVETIAMTDGTESTFAGYVSGVIRASADEWKLQHLHWSSPRDGGD
jgi:hypothetical protein